MKNPIQSKMKGVGIGGIVAIIVMSLVDQIMPGMIDFGVRTMGVSLGEAIMLLATWIPGYIVKN